MPFIGTDDNGKKYTIPEASSQEEADAVARSFNTSTIEKTKQPEQKDFVATAPDGSKYTVQAGSQEEADQVASDFHKNKIQSEVNRDPNREKISWDPSIPTAFRIAAQSLPWIGKQDKVLGYQVADTPESAQYKEDHPVGHKVVETTAKIVPSAIAAVATGGASVPAQMLAQGVVNGGSTLLNALADKNATKSDTVKDTAINTALGAAGPAAGKLVGVAAPYVAKGVTAAQGGAAGLTIGGIGEALLNALMGHGFSGTNAVLSGAAGALGAPAASSVLKNVVAPVMASPTVTKGAIPILTNQVSQEYLNAIHGQ